MKRKLFVLLVSGTILFAGKATAQSKTAYINIEDVVSIIPETAKVDSLLQKYQSDSIAPVYTQTISSYQAATKIYNDSANTTAAVHKNAEEDLARLSYQLQNWEQIQNQAIEHKRNSLLAPIYRKAYDAIKQVAKEKGYTHVVSKQVYLIAPPGDDIIVAVAAKLKIPVPKFITPGIK